MNIQRSTLIAIAGAALLVAGTIALAYCCGQRYWAAMIAHADIWLTQSMPPCPVIEWGPRAIAPGRVAGLLRAG